MKRILAGLVLVGWVIVLSAILATVLKAQLPSKQVPDLRGLDSVVVDSGPRAEMVKLLNPDHENAGCLYGGVTGHVLTVRDLQPPAQVFHSDSVSVGFTCKHSQDYIGLVHTHIFPNLCWHSEEDDSLIMGDDWVLVSYIICVEGVGEMKLRDGRFTWFNWRWGIGTGKY